ncbi:MAG: hypothetical protein L6R42_005595 [Xanthoria sp. 1 TBL-2021]|nr:MAG: hypothetical protein L6R42_005595 [Xanthoria sp. 1 TBL-2021]
MKPSTISAAFALLASVTSAAPSATQHEGHQVADGFARVQLFGEEDPNGKWEIIPLDFEWYDIYNPLRSNSMKTIDNVTCQFEGTEGTETWLKGNETSFIYVNPPQPQRSAACYKNKTY